MLVVASLIPCVLYAKAVADVNNWYVVFIAAGNVLIAVFRSYYNRINLIKQNAGLLGMQSDDEEKFGGRKKAFSGDLISSGYKNIPIITILIMIAAILIICAVIPRKSDAIFYDTFEDTFLGGDTKSEIRDVSGSLSDISGNADYRSNSNRRIYKVNGSNVAYLKRQVFDVYNFEQDRWYALDDWAAYDIDSDEWKLYSGALQTSILHTAVKDAAEYSPEFIEKYGLQRIVDSSVIVAADTDIYVNALNFEAEYYIVPPGAVTVVASDGEKAVVSWAGNFIRPQGKHSGDFGYRVFYVGDKLHTIQWCNRGGSPENSEKAGDMLSELIAILEDTADQAENSDLREKEIRTVKAYQKQLEDSLEYRDAVASNTEDIPEKVRELAEELTADCEYDWQKASVLQDYFQTGEFIYDLDYYAPDKSVEYFLFESKRGTCSDYATAYVLMARSVGLTVRYTEGYLAKSSGNYNSNTYYIKESSGHAFPEVYLPGAGWTVFEPTSGVVEENGANSFWSLLRINIQMDYQLIMTIASVIAAVAIIILIVRIIIPSIVEQVFRSRLSRGKKNAADAYRRILKRVKSGRLKKKYRLLVGRDRLAAGKDPFAMAPAEVKALFEEIEIDISVICNQVEKDAYRNREADKNWNTAEILKAYKKIISVFK